MQQFFYLVSPGHQGVEVRRVASVGQLQPLLDCLSKGEEPDFPRIHEFPEKVRLAKETLEQGKEGWLLIPAQESEGPSLGEADREFLESLRQAPAEEEPPGAIFTEIVSNVRSLLPPDVNLDHEIERFVVLYLIDLMAKPAILQASEASQGAPAAELPAEVPPALPPSLELPGDPVRIRFVVGKELDATFRAGVVEDLVKDWISSTYDDLVEVEWTHAAENRTLRPRSDVAVDEVRLFINDSLQGGLKFNPSDLDFLLLPGALEGLIMARLADSFRPENTARLLHSVEKSVPHTLQLLRDNGWTAGGFHRLFKLLLRRGLPLSASSLGEFLPRLDEIRPDESTEKFEVIAERCQITRNYTFGHMATELRAVKLSAETQNVLRNARTSNDLINLTELQNRGDLLVGIVGLVVPDDLCFKARMLFGEELVASEMAIPDDIKLNIVDEF